MKSATDSDATLTDSLDVSVSDGDESVDVSDGPDRHPARPASVATLVASSRRRDE